MSWRSFWTKSKKQKALEKEVSKLKAELLDCQIKNKQLSNEVEKISSEVALCDKDNNECVVFVRGIAIQATEFLKEKG